MFCAFSCALSRCVENAHLGDDRPQSRIEVRIQKENRVVHSRLCWSPYNFEFRVLRRWFFFCVSRSCVFFTKDNYFTSILQPYGGHEFPNVPWCFFFTNNRNPSLFIW
jgi:hypothetical protein